MSEPRYTFALVNGGVAVWKWAEDGTVQPPLVLRFAQITADDLEWAVTEAKRLGLGEGTTATEDEPHA